MKRRDFLKNSASMGAAFLLLKDVSVIPKSAGYDLVVAKNAEPEILVRQAVKELGGMNNFVNNGDIVVVKPNISWDRVPEQAATTNPLLVSEVVKMCLEAGAKEVKIFDHTLNEARRCYKRSGIEKAASEAGADVKHVYSRKFKKVSIPEGELVKSWEIYEDVLEADKIINIPIAKHHNLCQVSLSMKNYMGFLGGRRGQLHRDFDIKLTDINTFIKADLIILDSYRMLLRNGPSGGSLNDVKLAKTVVCGTNPVAIDSYGANLFGLDVNTIGFIKEASRRGLGIKDLQKLNIKHIEL
ncbi:MAG: DUF362 domain-containing protein [bacterium]